MSEDTIYRHALERIISLCQGSPESQNGELICGRVLEVAQAALGETAALPFKTGDRVRHVGRAEIGTVTAGESMYVQVQFDNPTPAGKVSVGTYDRAWFRIHPNGLVLHQQTPGA